MMQVKSLVVSFAIMTLLFTFSFIPIHAQPNIIEFPALSGSYQVGRTNYDMLDESREEIFTADENDTRAFTVTVFYPAVPDENAEPALYVEDALLPAIAQYTGVPESIWQAFQPHAYADAPIAEGEFPIILFSHGSGTPLVAYTGLMEDLASHGYIVIGISHTYNSPAVALSDGRILTLANIDNALSGDGDIGAEDRILLSITVADIIFVLDQLDNLNTNDDLLANHMDLSRIGTMGHSLGGSTALQTAYQDERILAVLNMDGWIDSEAFEYGINRPTMILSQDLSLLSEGEIPFAVVDEYEDEQEEVTSEDDLDTLIDAYINGRESALNNANPGYGITLLGASHDTYVTDVLILAETFPDFATPELIGTIDDLSGTRTNIHNTVIAFFNTYIAEANSPQMSELSFDGLEVTIYNEA